MASFIADSSVWIDFFNGRINNETDFLSRKIKADEPIAICPPILQEVLQGIRDDGKFEIVKDMMLDLEMLDWNFLTATTKAIDLYRSLRKNGITIRKGIDCLFACYAIEYNIPILHRDKDFEKIASRSLLKVIAA